MQKLTVTSQDRARKILLSSLGAEPESDTGIAELLRSEVSSRQGCPGHTLIKRVQQLTAPAVSLSPELLTETLDLLIREGDFIRIPGGGVVAGPVRLVDLTKGRFRVFSGMCTRVLQGMIPGKWISEGVRRTCLFESSAGEKMPAAISNIGGVSMNPSTWAGLDRCPKADDSWVHGLNRRLAWVAEPPASLERDGPLVWQRLTTNTDEGFNWRYSEPGAVNYLWRAKHPWMGWVWAWTDGQPPNQTHFVRLSSDESARTAFSLARCNATPVKMVACAENNIEKISIKAWLPLAEYRYLSVTALKSTIEKKQLYWEIPASIAGHVKEMLRDRLGLALVEEALS